MTTRPASPSLSRPWRIGIDVGGTFTDVVLVDAAGAIHVHKSPSEPANPAIAVVRALAGSAEALGLTVEALLEGCAHFIHGTTVATNVLLERKGAKVGLITTEGFRDTLEIRRGFRAHMWDHRTPWRDVLVPRSLRRPVTERISARGEVLRPLQEASLIAAAEVFERQAVDAVAICLLHSDINPAHERRCAALMRERLPGVYVTASSEIAPITGEFERSSTTVANAYVAPRVLPYLNQLEAELKGLGLRCPLLLVQSNGGAVSLAQIQARPAALALSGPAAGLAALKLQGRLLNARNLIAIEIGGTSCDVTVVHEGVVATADMIDVDETLIALPSVEIHTIGTGGGTICGVDSGGLLQAGPEGAGAKPGPACYGLGGTRPTVTDAQLVLGRLRPGSYAGGKLTLDPQLAESAVSRHVGAPLGLSPQAAAHAMTVVVEQSIRHAIEKVSLERGLDPTKFILVGAGGAGSLHVAEVARRLGCHTAFVPRLAGVFCAFGLCNAEIRHDLIRSFGRKLDAASLSTAAEQLQAMQREGETLLVADGFDAAQRRTEASFDLRYAGQQWTIRLAAPRLEAAELRRRFEAEHERLYASSQPEATIEIVNIRLTASGLLPDIDILAAKGYAPSEAPVAETRPAWLADGRHLSAMPILRGPELRPGHWFVGPAVIEEVTTTILIGEGDRVEVDAFGNYLLHISRASEETTDG